jgi:ribosomal protein L16 Arg81 hydroxylase
MSQISKTGLKKSQLEKGLKEAETKAAYWKKKALVYKQALEIVQNANPYEMR